MDAFDRLITRASAVVEGPDANRALWDARQALEDEHTLVVVYEMVLGAQATWAGFLQQQLPRLTEHLGAKGLTMLGGSNVVLALWRGDVMYTFTCADFFGAIAEIEGMSLDTLRERIKDWRVSAGLSRDSGRSIPALQALRAFERHLAGTDSNPDASPLPLPATRMLRLAPPAPPEEPEAPDTAAVVLTLGPGQPLSALPAGSPLSGGGSSGTAGQDPGAEPGEREGAGGADREDSAGLAGAATPEPGSVGVHPEGAKDAEVGSADAAPTEGEADGRGRSDT